MRAEDPFKLDPLCLLNPGCGEDQTNGMMMMTTQVARDKHVQCDPCHHNDNIACHDYCHQQDESHDNEEDHCYANFVEKHTRHPSPLVQHHSSAIIQAWNEAEWAEALV